MVAGSNAALSVVGKEPLVLSRNEAYTGVLIDDLIRRGTDEPYRIFTSRAEYRLLLGCETVLERLLPRALEVGLLSPETAFDAREALSRSGEVERIRGALEAEAVNPSLEIRGHMAEVGGRSFSEPKLAWDLLRRPGTSLKQVEAVISPELRRAIESLGPEERESLETRAHYAGYIEKLSAEIARMGKEENLRIPERFDFSSLFGLSKECLEKLVRVRPRTLGQASRISGMTPAARLILRIGIERGRRAEENQEIRG